MAHFQKKDFCWSPPASERTRTNTWGKPAWSVGSPKEDEEHGCADERGHGADRNLDGVRDDSRKGVGEEDEERSGERAQGEEPSVLGPDERAHRMRDEQPDERDDPDGRDPRSNKKHYRRESPVAHARNIDSYRLRGAITE